MPRTPEFVVTGLHVPKVHFWARVLVRPDRLQQVKHSILTMGQVFLQPGEVLEVETRPKEDIERAMTVSDYDAERPWGACIVAWNETAGDVIVYGDDADHIAAIAEPVAEAMAGYGRQAHVDPGVYLDCNRISSIRVGDVHVYFERETKADTEKEPNEPKGQKRTFDYAADPDLKAPSGISIRDLERLGDRVRS